MTDRYWLIGRSPSSLAPLIHREVATPQLDHTALWREVAGSVVAPTESFGYVNLGSLFESSYPALRVAIGFGLVGSEDVGPYVDAGKLPNAAVVSRHLGALALSQAAVPGGSLWEARGNISAGEALLAGAAAYLWSGAKLPELPGAAPSATESTPRADDPPATSVPAVPPKPR